MFVAENIEYAIVYIGQPPMRKAPGDGYRNAYLIQDPNQKSVTVFFPGTFDAAVVKLDTLSIYKRDVPYKHVIPMVGSDLRQRLIREGVSKEEIQTMDDEAAAEAAKFENTQLVEEFDGSTWASPFYKEYLYSNLKAQWEHFQDVREQVNYQTAAAIISGMGFEVPPRIIQADEETGESKSRGKEAAQSLLKVVPTKGKRGKVLQWFFERGNSGNMLEATIEFDTTRSNILSHLFVLNKDHGIGYAMSGDMVTITLPDECANPFDEEQTETDDWLD